MSLDAAIKVRQMTYRMQTEQVEEEQAAWSLKNFVAKRDIVLLLVTVFLLHLGNGGITPLTTLVTADISTEIGKEKEELVFPIGVFAAKQLSEFTGIATYEVARRTLGGHRAVLNLAVALISLRALLNCAILETADRPRTRDLIVELYKHTFNTGEGSGDIGLNGTNTADEGSIRYGYAATVLLEGFSVGWTTVVFQILLKDASKETGRFGLATSLMPAAVHTGAGLSAVIAGYIYDVSPSAAFLTVAILALFAIPSFMFAVAAVERYTAKISAK